MIAKLWRAVPAVAAALILFAGVRPTECKAWSVWNPFASSSDKAAEAKPKKTVKKQPSTLDKVVAAPKNMFNAVGNTITGKKPEPKKPTSQMYATMKAPAIHPPKKEKSWLPSWMKPEEPKKDKTVSEWLTKERLDP